MNAPVLAPTTDLPNDYEPFSQQWRFRDHRDGEVATYAMGSVTARVDDMDGDFSAWEVLQHGAVIASGSDPYFWDAVAAVEDVLVEIGWLYRPGEPASEAA